LPVHRAAVEWARGVVLARGPSALSADAVGFLLRDYVASGSGDVRELVEQGLTTALSDGVAEADPGRRLQWLRVLTEATALSDDPRLRDTVARALAPALDALELFVRRTYEPGEGLMNGTCAQQLRWSAALLDAFDLSGRLPYAMLADELLQHARRHWWRDAAAAFDADFAANCEALRVLCRLATLHADPEYRAAAVLAPTSSCASDAGRLVDRLAAEADRHPAHAAEFGSAMLDWFALERKLQ
jgi:hypothetical protein